ncbi:calcium load-activated calcium channel-like [Paramacrobiotus metropolitanus]|uniref:calcium load-activated calcium channel-like n=1 Tax=Paramacrobiotus metropolitanus TaxID=2943436 RepID=UPI002445A1B3|nr:calcium load-activated calcium channel-like [Paramacrobiotus metropolitanus]
MKFCSRMIADAVLIIVVSFIASAIGEGLTWLLVYRTDRYKKLKAEIDRQVKKVEKKKKEETAVSRNKKKMLDREEGKLKHNNRELSMVKMKSIFAIGVAFSAMLSIFSALFEGKVVAKLPFIPFGLFQGLSHRNLLGSDYTDCSYLFLYILCTMSIRQNLQKILGFAPARSSNQNAGFFTPPTTK